MKTVAPKLSLAILLAGIIGYVSLTFAQTPPSPPTGTHERTDLKVLKVYSASDGDARYRAYVVEWKGQEVVVEDRLIKTNNNVGDTIAVLVMRRPFPQGQETYDILSFGLLPLRPR